MKGTLFVISAPSGTGKTTMLKKVMSRLQGLQFSVSHTTRKPRSGEKNGIDYHFVERDQFEKMIREDRFIEYARVHDKFYGTSTAAVIEQLKEGKDVVLDIDVQGASIIRKSESLESVQIFIAPPGVDELERRLRGRNTEDEETVRIRLENAKKEMEAAGEYDYLIVNDQLEVAADVLSSIIIAERARMRRHPSGDAISLQ